MLSHCERFAHCCQAANYNFTYFDLSTQASAVAAAAVCALGVGGIDLQRARSAAAGKAAFVASAVRASPINADSPGAFSAVAAALADHFSAFPRAITHLRTAASAWIHGVENWFTDTASTILTFPVAGSVATDPGYTM